MPYPIGSSAAARCGWLVGLVLAVVAHSPGGELIELDFDPASVFGPALKSDTAVILAAPLFFEDLDREQRREAQDLLQQTSPLRQATMLQPTPFLLPTTPLSDSPTTPAATTTLSSQLFEDEGLDRSILRQAKGGVASLSNDIVRGAESIPRVTTDLGDLLGDAPVR